LSLGLTWHCVETTVGEENNYAIYFNRIVGVEDTMVAMEFCASFEHNVKRMNFSI
jgi:hypothetical protein